MERPDGKGGKGSAAGKSGSVAYRLTPEEFLDLFLEDFELPDLIRQKLGEVTDEKFSSAGFSTTGSPARMSISRTAAEAFKRRIALGRIKNKRRVKVLRAQLEQCDESDQERRQALEIEIGELEKKLRGVNYLEELDIRYRRYEPEPNPITRAVMFCLMDVSVSMTEHRKDLAKGFYALLYIFLKREYEKVDVVFLRHTHEAEEVDEQTFFRGGESGGTKVSTVYELMSSVIDDRYPPSEWNIYAAEASDGDNDASDSELVAQMLREQLLPMMQYLAYVEVGEETTSHNWTPTKSQLWAALDILHEEGKPVVLRHINKRSEIYPVFTELFGKHSEDRAR